MTRSVRFTSFDFDQSRYDSMLSDFEAIQKGVLDGIAGLARTRIGGRYFAIHTCRIE